MRPSNMTHQSAVATLPVEVSVLAHLSLMCVQIEPDPNKDRCLTARKSPGVALDSKGDVFVFGGHSNWCNRRAGVVDCVSLTVSRLNAVLDDFSRRMRPSKGNVPQYEGTSDIVLNVSRMRAFSKFLVTPCNTESCCSLADSYTRWTFILQNMLLPPNTCCVRKSCC